MTSRNLWRYYAWVILNLTPRRRPPRTLRGARVELEAAEEAASVAHDFIWGRNGVTQEQASQAIWTIHNALRPLLARCGK